MSNFISDFFSSSMESVPGPKLKETPWGPEARSFLMDLMKEAVEFPTLQTAGMTDVETQVQSVLMDIMEGKAFQDPRESPLYEGMRAESERMEEKAVSALKRRDQMDGGFFGSQSISGEGELRGQFANSLLMQLGQLFETERARDNPYTRAAIGSQLGGLPRQLEQQQMGNQYTKQVSDLMFPYQTQSQIATQLLQYAPWHQPQFYSQPSGFSEIAYPVAALIGAFTGGGGGGNPTPTAVGTGSAPAPTTVGTGSAPTLSPATKTKGYFTSDYFYNQ